MDYFMCKLIPPRPTFPQDMSSGERELMRQHAEYWTGLLQQKKVLLFGPVMAPEGAFGLSVLALSDEAVPAQAAEEICREDPVQRGNIGFRFEVYPMPRIVH